MPSSCDLEDPPSAAASGNPATPNTPAKNGFPTKAEVLAAIPKECFNRSVIRSSLSLLMSLAMTLGSGALAYAFIPLSWAWLPAWIAYAVVAGTAATGCWVVAHECGHRAFAKRNWLQDAIGYCLHSSLLVPYFSWQRSHAVHHARTNHLDLGETHVPLRDTTPGGKAWQWWQETIGDEAFAIVRITIHFLIGWPLYLLTGATGGPSRGTTNHFWPAWPFSAALFPGGWTRKVWLSDIGVLVAVALLGWWAYAAGVAPVLALYVGPYLVVNFWLVLYTWLQHTDVDIPHFGDEEWTWVKGAFMTVDRPYGAILNFMHHHIGSTHVAHHMDARIPHYHAVKATHALRESFPELYRFDPTPIPQALWRVATRCHVVSKGDEGWTFAGPGP
ncbi:MAG: fatty acid desaturase [Planctomycetota bacterium]|nr:fatty acid desaturase [Planctomycetota bacterium]MDA1202078.1 fatty acid desaturase [Planctomycetota bacterium]